jgi:hypothetical protein
MLKTTNKQILRNLFIFSTSIEEKVNQKIQHLTFQARQAYYNRDYRKVAQCSDELIKLSPRSEYAGLYFHALSISQYGSGSNQETEQIYKMLAQNAPPAVQSAAILALGLKALKSNQLDDARRLLTESYRISVVNNCAPITAIQTQSALSTLYSLQGDNQASALVLEELLPELLILGKAFPAYLGIELNNYAYALHQLGEFQKATHLINGALSLPHASAYPEWQETAHEIQEAQAQSHRNDASVAVSSSKSLNVAPSNPKALNVETTAPKDLNVVDIASYKRTLSISSKEIPKGKVIRFPIPNRYFHLNLTSKDKIFNFLCNLDIDDSQESEERLMELLYLLNFLCTDSEADYTIRGFISSEQPEAFQFQGNLHPSELGKLFTLIGNVEAYARRNPLPKHRQQFQDVAQSVNPA